MNINLVKDRKRLTAHELEPGMIIWRVYNGNRGDSPHLRGCYIVAGEPYASERVIHAMEINLISAETGKLESGFLGDMGLLAYIDGSFSDSYYTVRGLPEEWRAENKKLSSGRLYYEDKVVVISDRLHPGYRGTIAGYKGENYIVNFNSLENVCGPHYYSRDELRRLV